MRWGVKIPLRDGVNLNATLYLPQNGRSRSPVILTATPYIGQTYHDRGMYFAAHGYPFLTVDVRGRGNSEGEFHPFIGEARDGYDVIEWVAQQPYCNGKVAMWGGSYAGFAQWAAAKEFPPHLATIVPVASVFIGLDMPMRSNIFWPYLMQWLTYTSGRTLQNAIFEDHVFWSGMFCRAFEAGIPFKELDTFVGNPSKIFQEWISHPQQDSYWDQYNPTSEQYRRMSIPILTITGCYDNAQRGALAHYRRHMQSAPIEERLRHYLVIGPWDHAGTRTPAEKVGGVDFGAESRIDLGRLHLDWYEWTMNGGSKPQFLKKNVVYYVAGTQEWRYADNLDAVTERYEALYLDSPGTASRLSGGGVLKAEIGSRSEDQYVYDPRDTASAKSECAASDPLALRPSFPSNNLLDQSAVYGRELKRVVYHSSPFRSDTVITGFFRLSVWISIDQPDTDISVSICEVDSDRRSILLTSDAVRARYRESLREGKLIDTTMPLKYEFDTFTFVSRVVKAGSRLRLMIGPIDSIYSQKNYNTGGVVSEESLRDGRPVIVRVFHSYQHPSVLDVPHGLDR